MVTATDTTEYRIDGAFSLEDVLALLAEGPRSEYTIKALFHPAVKLHVGLNHVGYLPEFITVAEGQDP